MIEPSTNIRLLQGIPLSSTYKHTIRFSSASEQSTYFKQKTKHTLSKQTYQRVNRGYARVGLSADDCYDCNYMMFRNTAYGSKWFYAFITAVEYVNDHCCEIAFQIDVMQTWLFDVTVKECMVVREHSSSDDIGHNILPEPVQLGEYKSSERGSINVITPLGVIVAISDSQKSVGGNLFEGVFTGCTYYGYNTSDQGDLEALKIKLLDYVQSPDSIVGMWMCPVTFMGTRNSEHEISSTDKGYSFTTAEGDIPVLTGDVALDNYTPKNKKLYTYPYNYLMLDNGSDNSLVLRYEFFKKYSPIIRIEGTKNAPVRCSVYPMQYKGYGDNPYRPESLTMGDYPMCSWNNDAYKVWLAQNSYPRQVKMAQSVVNSVVGATASLASYGTALANADLYTGKNKASHIQSATNTANLGLLSGITNAVMNPMNEYINQTLSNYNASIQADPIKGTIGNSNLLISQKQNAIFYSRMTVNYENARSIDNFFTCFGYATNRLKVPNVFKGSSFRRPHWNYVQTNGAIVYGTLPASDTSLFSNILNGGITFWENPDEIGDYSLDNSPV